MQRVPSMVVLAMLVSACGSDPPPAPLPPAPPPAPVASVTPPAKPKAAPPKADASVISRQILFGNPERAGVKISYDGKALGWLAPKDGVMNVYIAPIGDLAKAKAITDEKNRPINGWTWMPDG